ncbi:glycosyltransferase family 2 protein [Brevibacillus antibioticus]|uniref:Glycosyltransferase family 2 protein n=1 Tax=Brevibacillus antibioticus TaxID=2570228 RepID=A0A4U2YEV5_9BACL|nr:glycosyltransferase family A protein [Brevibacillus antibioticus]TKI59290.1 glycosyltransferase family 2 protein [Brevibacillus antibioticus]
MRDPTKKRREEHINDKEKCQNINRLSVILCVHHEQTIQKVLKQIEKLRPMEIVLVVDGCPDQSVKKILTYSTCPLTAFVYPFPLGDDVWRAIGAKEATGDVWLFLDAAHVVAANDMQSFVRTCYQGADIVLRKPMTPLRQQPSMEPDTVLLAKTFLNTLVSRHELGTSSMYDLPFAMTRQAASIIGVQHLVVPAVAHAIALHNQLRVVPSPYIASAKLTKKRATQRKNRPSVNWTILGDHLEAMDYVMSLK